MAMLNNHMVNVETSIAVFNTGYNAVPSKNVKCVLFSKAI